MDRSRRASRGVFLLLKQMPPNKVSFVSRIVSFCLIRTFSPIQVRNFLLSHQAQRLWNPIGFSRLSEPLLEVLLEIGVLDPLSKGNADFDTQLLPLLHSCQSAISHRLTRGNELPVALEEAGLRLALLDRPEDIDLTYSLISLLVRHGRSPLPDRSVTFSGPIRDDAEEDWIVESLKERLRQHEDHNDTFGIHAVLWQMVVRLPGKGRGWAELARDTAARGDYPNALHAIEQSKSMSNSLSTKMAIAETAVMLANSSVKVPEDIISAIEMQASHSEEGFLVASAQYLRHQSGDHNKAGMLASLNVSAHSLSAPALLLQAKNAYYASDFSAMYNHLRMALELDPVPVWHDIVRSFSGQTSIALEKIGKYDELADWFSAREELASSINLIPPFPNRLSSAGALRLREEAMAKGLPPALLVTQAKSGSVSVGAIFNHGFRLPTVVYGIPIGRVVLPWARDFMRGGGCHTTHMWGTEHNIDLLIQAGVSRVMVHVRDPRQVLLSRVHHYKRYQSGNTQEFNQSFQELAMEEQVDFMAEIEFEKIVTWIERWVDASRKLDVRFTTFEEFSRNKDAFFEKVLENYGADTRHFDKRAATDQHEGIDYHYRKGETDEWRKVFTRRQIESYNARIPDTFWKLFNWNP